MTCKADDDGDKGDKGTRRALKFHTPRRPSPEQASSAEVTWLRQLKKKHLPRGGRSRL